MSGSDVRPDPAPGAREAAPDAADARMAELLQASGSPGELRARLEAEGSADTDDLLGRVNALEFVGSLVGEPVDMPERLGGYRVRGLLGRGGMGTVYEAFQEQLERVVALKVLSAAWSADPTMRNRFRAEARATAALHHRHIVPIYDFGETQGCLYFAMEKVDGVSLDRHISAARRSWRPPMAPLEAARRFAGVADALGLAHRRRILHRDVKPGNILVGGDGTLALTDFGLAKALDRASARLTAGDGGFLGTLHYASPEQALGRELTPASDLYSLGVTMFEAITGELPLSGKSTEAMLRAVLEERPRRLREFVHRPPRDLDLVLDKLLAKEPADRYQDGEELARDLLRIADGEPVHIRRQSPFVLLWRRMRKNPVLSSAIIACSVLLLATVALWSGLRRERGQSLLSRHQNDLVRIVNDVKSEPGPAWGPEGLHQCLTGVELPAGEPSAAVLARIERARAELPEDPAPEALREAYLADPLSAATELLRQGRGFEALQRLTAAIGDDLAGRTFADLTVELRLYRLYVARAVAQLTESVSSLTDARTDLALASFLRPGAVYPRLLIRFLDLAQNGQVPVALERLAADVTNPGQRLAMGCLLRSLAGLRPVRGANLMEFRLGYEDRLLVQELAERWIAAAQPAPLPESGAGLGTLLATTAREALSSLGRVDSLQMLLQGGRRILEVSAHPDSTLQAWRIVFHLLEQPAGTGAPIDGEGREHGPALQLLGWTRLLSLLQLQAPQRQLLDVLLPRFEILRREHPALPGMARVAALIHGAVGSAEADALAARWVAEAPADPEALRCRMASHLRAGRIDRALDDGMAAVQASLDRHAAAADVSRAFQSAADLAGRDERAGRLRELAAAFRQAGP